MEAVEDKLQDAAAAAGIVTPASLQLILPQLMRDALADAVNGGIIARPDSRSRLSSLSVFSWAGSYCERSVELAASCELRLINRDNFSSVERKVFSEWACDVNWMVRAIHERGEGELLLGNLENLRRTKNKK